MMATTAITGRLQAAEWLQRPETQRLFAVLDGEEGRTRAVGGIVRDTLLGRPQHRTDIDLATELLPQEVAARAAEAGAAAYPTGIAHGTVTLRLDGVIAEVTTLREDIETDGRRAVVRFGTDWERDAARRDFTLNALYAGMHGELFDPVGGLEDCIAGRVRFIGEPAQRIAEDRLRVYRFFRFSASHGGESFDADGLAACKNAAGTLGELSAERVGGEFRRLLDLPRVATTLEAMAAADILWTGREALRRLRAYEDLAGEPKVAGRLALLIAETGARQLQDRWRLANDEIACAEAIRTAAALLTEQRLNEAAYRYPAALTDGADVAAVLGGWSHAARAAVAAELQALSVPQFPLSGADLIAAGMQPGKALGDELERLEQRWIESGFTLDRTQLLAARG